MTAQERELRMMVQLRANLIVVQKSGGGSSSKEEEEKVQ